MPDQPLAIRPDVVILGIFGEHAGEERKLRVGHRVNMRHDSIAVMPNLVVLEMFKRNAVEPSELFKKVFLECEDSVCSVKPNGVMCWVHANDVFCEGEHALGLFIIGHDSS